jgi:hypothetical protein
MRYKVDKYNLRKKIINLLIILVFSLGFFLVGINIIHSEESPFLKGEKFLTNTGEQMGYKVAKKGSERWTILLNIFSDIIKTVAMTLGVIVTAIIIYGGYLYMTAGGNEERVSAGRKWIRNGILGLLLIAFVFIITQVVFSFIGTALTGHEKTWGEFWLDAFK